jgi:hypothetical protein
MKNGFLGFFVRLAMIFMVFSFFSCASTSKYKEISVSEFQQLYNDLDRQKKLKNQSFMVEAYINNYYGSYSNRIEISDVSGVKEGMSVFLHDNADNCRKYEHNHSKKVEIYRENALNSRIDERKKYIIYIGLYYRYGYDIKIPFVDKIVGLRTTEEAAAIEAQKKAEREAAEAEAAEAKRIAQEEADRYDPSKFTIVPSNFRPSRYTSIDLFAAVATIEKMPSVNPNNPNTGRGDLALTTRLYATDVVFVSQNGTDILFRTNDNAISQNMKVDNRSGLSAGQRVRIYYRVTKHPFAEWRIEAIERL